MENWVLQAKRADFKRLGEKFGIDQVTARIIRNRGNVTDEEFDRYLNGSPKDLYDPHLLSGADQAADIIASKIRDKKRIMVIGDYDIDGVCASYILVTALKRAGADVICEIPERMTDGYGLNIRLVEDAVRLGADTIITCDNGIAARDSIAYAKAEGLTVIVTDHHEPPFHMEGTEKVMDLPEADICIDPKLPWDTYPFKNICGAVVAWKLMIVLCEKMGLPETYWMDLIEEAAFATVGDVMDLTDENRIIVKYGLKALRDTSNPGMRALIRACGLEGQELAAWHVGFLLGPCINASGRLETAERSLKLLLEPDGRKAEVIAEELTELNEERKSMTAKAVEEGIALIEDSCMKDDKVLVVYLPDCHESIAGIVAGKIRERFARPTLVLTNAAEEGMAKGSGRSVEVYNMFEGLNACAGLMEKFGGHPMAAGLTLKIENIERLRSALNRNCTLSEKDLIPTLMIDVPMPVDYITENLIEELSILEPCGKANEKPLFAQKDLLVTSMKILGKNGNVLKCSVVSPGGRTVEAIYFGNIDELLRHLEEKYSKEAVSAALAGGRSNMRMSIVYYPGINEFRGNRTIQITIKSYH